MAARQGNYDRDLFPAEFLQQLCRWKWLLKKKMGNLPVASAMNLRGGGIGDFLGYHPYNPGDDIRYLDWHIYGRTGQLVVKDFARQGHARSLILIDGSASMDFGTPTKFTVSLRIGAALAYLGLQNACMIQIAIASDKEVHLSYAFNNPSHFQEVLYFLSWKRPQGKLQWESVHHLLPEQHKCLIFMCSDLMAAGGAEAVFKRIALQGNHGSLFHVMAEEELNPRPIGPTCLWDVERGEGRYCLLDEKVLQNYQKKVYIFKKRWHNVCLKYKIDYVAGTSKTPVLGWLS